MLNEISVVAMLEDHKGPRARGMELFARRQQETQITPSPSGVGNRGQSYQAHRDLTWGTITAESCLQTSGAA